MLVDNFKDNCIQYNNFAVWDVENMDAFFKGNTVITEIFQNDFKFPIEEFNERRSEIEQSNMEIMKHLLDQIGDKHFFIFTYHDDAHSELVQMQRQDIMNFGLDIENISQDHVYILMMDKKNEFKAFEA